MDAFLYVSSELYEFNWDWVTTDKGHLGWIEFFSFCKIAIVFFFFLLLLSCPAFCLWHTINTNVQIYKITNMQITNVQISKICKYPNSKISNVQISKITQDKVSKISGLHFSYLACATMISTKKIAMAVVCKTEIFRFLQTNICYRLISFRN